MNELDIERVKLYEMPEGDLEKVTAEYKETAFDKIKQFTKVQFLPLDRGRVFKLFS